jgi:uncharacterized small protein (DUF1192 family)
MMLSDCTRAEFIFSKQTTVGGEHIYVLKFVSIKKKHAYVERRLAELDECLKMVSGNADSTWFVSIGEEEHMNKARSFGRGEIRRDHLFKEIFDVDLPKVNGDYPLKAGVLKWSPSLEQEADEAEGRARAEEDLRVQEAVQEADPGAFGGEQDEFKRARLRLQKQSDLLGEELRTRTLELEEMRKELVTLRLGASRVKEMEEWYFVRQTELGRERQRLGRVLAGLELPGMEEAVAAFREEIGRVKAESEANVAGLVSIKERDARIAALEEENVKLTQRLENANRAAGEADSKVSIMEDVVAGCGVARKEIRKRTSGVYTGLDDLWEGTPSFFDEAVGEIVEKNGGGEKKKKKVEKIVTFSVR